MKWEWLDAFVRERRQEHHIYVSRREFNLIRDYPWELMQWFSLAERITFWNNIKIRMELLAHYWGRDSKYDREKDCFILERRLIVRDCVRRFAEAMDAMLTEKEEGYGPVETFIKEYDSLHHGTAAMEHLNDALDHLDEKCDDEDLRGLIHAANFCMMAWNRVKIHD